MPDLPDFFREKRSKIVAADVKAPAPSLWYQIYAAARDLKKENVLHAISLCGSDDQRIACIKAAGRYLYDTNVDNMHESAKMLKEILDERFPDSR